MNKHQVWQYVKCVQLSLQVRPRTQKYRAWLHKIQSTTTLSCHSNKRTDRQLCYMTLLRGHVMRHVQFLEFPDALMVLQIVPCRKTPSGTF